MTTVEKSIHTPRVSLAGEFAVLSHLALLGKDANMTLGNTKGVDILVSDPKTGRMVKVEVKTHCRDINDNGIDSEIFGRYLSSWIMNKKNETYDKKKDTNLFYCFVSLGKPKHRFFIIPAKIVAEYIRWECTHYRTKKEKVGHSVREVSFRNFRIGSKLHKDRLKQTPTIEKYENNWEFKT